MSITLVETGCSFGDLLAQSMQEEQRRDEEFGDDCEGATLSSRPPSPLSDLTDSDGNGEVDPPAIVKLVPPSHDQVPKTTAPPGVFTSPPTPAGQTTVGIEKQRQKISAGMRRKARRAKGKAAEEFPNAAYSYRLKASNIQTYRERAAKAIKFNVKSLATYAASTAWVGKRAEGTNRTVWTLDEVLARGFCLIEWDGV